MVVNLATKDKAYETSWFLGNCNSNQTYENNQNYSKSCCLDRGKYNLRCLDSGADGWNGGFITIQGKRYCQDFDNDEFSMDIDIMGKF